MLTVHTIDFYLSKTRDAKSAKGFFKKILAFSPYVSQPRVTTVETNPAYPVVIQRLKEWTVIHNIWDGVDEIGIHKKKHKRIFTYKTIIIYNGSITHGTG